ncbi:mucin-binding protein [Ligilactobacillus equi]
MTRKKLGVKKKVEMPEIKKRYKMYKAKGRWLVAPLVFLSLGLANTGLVHADSVDGDANYSSDKQSENDNSQLTDEKIELGKKQVSTVQFGQDTIISSTQTVATKETATSEVSSQVTAQSQSVSSVSQETTAKVQASPSVATDVAPTVEDPTNFSGEVATNTIQTTNTDQAVDDSQVVAKVAQALQQLKGVSPEQAQTMAKDAVVNDRQTTLQLADLMTSGTDANNAVVTPSQKQNVALLATNLATDSTTAGDYSGNGKVGISKIAGQFKTEVNNEGEKVYTFGYDGSSMRQMTDLSINYTAQLGDKITMKVVPKGGFGSGVFYLSSSSASGNPTASDDSSSLTWTVTQGRAGDMQQYIQTFVKYPTFFYSEPRAKMTNYYGTEVSPYVTRKQPALTGEITSGVTLGEDAGFDILFYINGQLYKPGTTHIKYVPEPESFETSIGIYTKTKDSKVVNESYAYEVSFKNVLDPLKNFDIEIQVPEDFVLDSQQTEQINRSYSKYYGLVKITQSGKGQPIILSPTYAGVVDKNSYTDKVAFPNGLYDKTDTRSNYSKQDDVNTQVLDPLVVKGFAPESDFRIYAETRKPFFFVGKYTDNAIDKNNEFTFKKAKVTTLDDKVHDLSIDAKLSEKVVGSGSEKYSILTSTTQNDSGAKRLDSIYEPLSRLASIGLDANGQTSFTPTYKIEIPDGITTTGIVMPLNYIDGTGADFGSYGPAEKYYNVVVHGKDGSSITQKLEAGESYNPLTGVIDNKGTLEERGQKLVKGVAVFSYEVTPETPYYANTSIGSHSANGGRLQDFDIATGFINILGFLNKSSDEDSESIKVSVTSKNCSVYSYANVKVIKNGTVPEYLLSSEAPSSYSSVTRLTTNDTFSTLIAFYNTSYKSTGTPESDKSNLDAAGILKNQADKTNTDLSGGSFARGDDVNFTIIHNPKVIITLPKDVVLNMQKQTDGDFNGGRGLPLNSFYELIGVTDKITGKLVAADSQINISRTKNSKGNDILIMEFPDTLEFNPKSSRIKFFFKISPTALNSFVVHNTPSDLYVYHDSNGVEALYSKDDLDKRGVSVDGLVKYDATTTVDSDATTLVQLVDDSLSGDYKAYDTDRNGSILGRPIGISRTKVTTADGSSYVTIPMAGTVNNYKYFQIVADQFIRPTVSIQGTDDAITGLSREGHNYSIQDWTVDSNGHVQGLQKLQMKVTNNTKYVLPSTYTVMNLPQQGKKDPNDSANGISSFTLKISGAGVPDTGVNEKKDVSELLYSTELVTMSANGKTFTFEDGAKWTVGDPLPDQIKRAENITDWSQVKALILKVDSLTNQNDVAYVLKAYSPTSINNENTGKKVTMNPVTRHDKVEGLADTLLYGPITDEYDSAAKLNFVDQNGYEINGYPGILGVATFDKDKGVFEVNVPGLIGPDGKEISDSTGALGEIPTISGYVYDETTSNNDWKIKNNGSTIVTRHYILSSAQLRENSLSGNILAIAKGNETPNTGAENPTGTDNISFTSSKDNSTVTDTTLAKNGYSYTIDVYQKQNGGNLRKVNADSYTSLSDALKAYPTFDDQADTDVTPTQVFVVNYKADFQQAVIISDNDPSKLIPSDTNAAIKTETSDYTINGEDYGVGLYYSFGVTGGQMFHTANGQSGLSNDTYARAGYTYTLTTPDGTVYKFENGKSPIENWMATNPVFDDTDNLGKTDSNIQVFKLHYEANKQVINYTIIDDTDNKPLAENQFLVDGKYDGTVPALAKTTYNAKVEEWTDKGYVLVSQQALPSNFDDSDNVVGADGELQDQTPQVVEVHLKHGYEIVDGNATVTQTITYKYGGGPHAGQKVSEVVTGDKFKDNVQTFEFNSKTIKDKVTGENAGDALMAQIRTDESKPDLQVVTWTPANQNSEEITSPDLPGYKAVVQGGYAKDGAANVVKVNQYNNESENTNIEVLYNPGEAGIVIHYVDVYGKNGDQATYEGITDNAGVTETVGKLLSHDVTQNGEADASYTVDSGSLWNYAGEGYKLVFVQQGASDGTFSDDPESPSNYYIFLTHDVKAVTEVKQVSGTITYTYENGVKAGQKVRDDKQMTANVTKTTQVDQVTQKNQVVDGQEVAPTYSTTDIDKGTVNGTTGAFTFTAVPSEAVQGYSLKNADQANVTIVDVPYGGNKSENIPYVADKQVLTYTVIDTGLDGQGHKVMVDGKQLAEGLTNQTISGTTQRDYTNIQDSYKALGYTIVSADQLPTTFDDSALTPDGNDSAPQNVVIKLKHTLVTPNTPDDDPYKDENTKTVKQTITYTYGNGPKKDQEAHASDVQNFSFTRTNQYDSVEWTAYQAAKAKGETPEAPEIQKSEWSTDQTSKDVTSPAVPGYVPTQASVGSNTYTHNSEDAPIKVLYNAETQRVNIYYIDVYGVKQSVGGYTPLDGAQLNSRTQTLVGDADTEYTNTLWDFASAGYVLATDDSKPNPESGALSGKFDDDANADQNYYVYLTHSEDKKVTPKVVTQTITYKYENGPKKGQEAAEPKTSDYTFTHTVVTDKVTGEIITDTWTPAQTTKTEESPVIECYKASQTTVPGQSVNHETPNITVEVTYKADTQAITYTVIDDTDGKTLVSDKLLANGPSNSDIPENVQSDYKTIISGYENQGYELVSADDLPGSFDDDPDVTQNVVIHLKHGTTETVTKKPVTTTVTFVYGDGPKKGQEVHKPVTSTYTFTHTVVTDKVTGTPITDTWTPSQTTSVVESPNVDGYTPDKPFVPETMIDHNTPNQSTVVTYTQDRQDIIYTVIDDTTGETLVSDKLLANGGVGDDVTDQTQHDYDGVVTGYEGQGYELVSADKLPTNYTDSGIAQRVVVHLTHGVDTTVTKKVVTQTITYVDHDGNKVADPSKTDYTFTHTVETDKVTGKTITDTWTPSQTTDKVTSPTVDGYKPDKDVVGGFTVTHGTPDINETVTYTKKITDAQVPARVVVHHIDVNGVELPAGGYTAQDGKEIANTQQTLDGYVGDNYQNTMWDYASAGYELVSTLGNPTSGKFTTEAGEAYVFLKHGTKKVTGTPISKKETIKYVNTDGDEVAETKEIVKTFTPVYTTDAVTGDILITTWNGDGRTDAVVSPTIDGYTPDKFVVESMLLTPDGDDQLVVVTYTPDATPEVPETPAPEPEVPATPTPAPEVPVPELEAPATPAPAPKHEAEKPVAAKEAPALPQTGEDGNEAAVLLGLGLGLVSAATLLGATELGRKRRKQN